MSDTEGKPSAVFIQWPPTGRTQWVGRASFDRELSAAGWVLVIPQPERPAEDAGDVAEDDAGDVAADEGDEGDETATDDAGAGDAGDDAEPDAGEAAKTTTSRRTGGRSKTTK